MAILIIIANYTLQLGSTRLRLVSLAFAHRPLAVLLGRVRELFGCILVSRPLWLCESLSVTLQGQPN